MLGLGKDPGQSFQVQISAITLTLLRYNLLAYLKERQATRSSTEELFHQLEQEIAPLSSVEKIIASFRQCRMNILAFMQHCHCLSIDVETVSTLIFNSINEKPLYQRYET